MERPKLFHFSFPSSEGYSDLMMLSLWKRCGTIIWWKNVFADYFSW